MRNFRAPLNQSVCKSYDFRNKVAGWSSVIIFKETPAKILSCEFCLVSQNTHLQNIWKGRFLLFFLEYYVLLCEELQVQSFSNNANFNQFKKKTAKFHVMRSDIYMKQPLPVSC